MASDLEILQKAGMDVWHNAAGWAAVVFAILAVVFGAAREWGIPNLAAAKYLRDEKAALAAEGLTQPVWLKTEKQLLADNFRPREMPGGLVLFEKARPSTNNRVPGIEAVLRKDNVTVTVADVLAIDDRSVWAFGEDDKLFDGTEELKILQVINRSGIADIVAPEDGGRADIVCIGLESYPSREQGDGSEPSKRKTTESLSKRRASNCAHEFSTSRHWVMPRALLQYWALDLGKAQVEARKDSAEEQRQRAAIIVALTRRQTVEERVTLAEAIATITTGVSVYGTDLTKYANSGSPGENMETHSFWRSGTGGFEPLSTPNQ